MALQETKQRDCILPTQPLSRDPACHFSLVVDFVRVEKYRGALTYKATGRLSGRLVVPMKD